MERVTSLLLAVSQGAVGSSAASTSTMNGMLFQVQTTRQCAPVSRHVTSSVELQQRLLQVTFIAGAATRDVRLVSSDMLDSRDVIVLQHVGRCS